MWNDKTKQLVADGKLVVIGVVQEQHAERARLYKQWKQYDFPIAQDSITSLGLAVVPVPVLIDEFGYVISARPKYSEIEQLVAQKTMAPNRPAPELNPEHVTADWIQANGPNDAIPESKCAIGDALLRKGTIDSIRQAIDVYQSSSAAAIEQNDNALTGRVYFRLGVAYRGLFDLTKQGQQDPADFTKASAFWSRALALNPNQYIWRRRIQQYGPKQMKPYPFYDWVAQAQREILARGETPIELKVPLSGAEIAQPNRKFETESAAENSPDPNAEIKLDAQRLIKYHATVVPSRVVAGGPVRVHLRFEPNQGHWNNEADEMVVWMDDSESGSISNCRMTFVNPENASSDESRTFEFEFKTNRDARGELNLKGYALYYVCTDENGQCLYRRLNLSIPIELEAKR